MLNSTCYALTVQTEASDHDYLLSLWADRDAAADYPDDPDLDDAPWHSSLDLAGVIDQEVRCYESMDGDAYELIASRLRELAAEVRFLSARTAADFHARAELMIDQRAEEAGQ